MVARRARLTDGGFRAGFSFRLAREPLARLFYDRGYAVDARLHAIERMRVLAARALGYENHPLGPPSFELEVPEARFDWMSSPADGDHPRRRPTYAVLLHATARPEKAWPAPRWAALIAILAAEGILPVLPWGNAREREAAEELVNHALASPLSGGIRPLIAPAMSLPEAASLLAGARVVVGVDTGLLHLASALDVPTVGLFGATPRWRYAPYWSTHAINLGSFGELGAQPALVTVVEALERLDVVVPGVASASPGEPTTGGADSARQARGG
jgi:heptosyltransferase-1